MQEPVQFSSVKKIIPNFSGEDTPVLFYDKTDSLIDMLKLSQSAGGRFPILVSNIVDKKGRDYAITLPTNQIYAASRRVFK